MNHVWPLISLTPPASEAGFERTESLFFSIENLNEIKSLVRMSASWSLYSQTENSGLIGDIVPHKMNVNLNMFGA